MPHHPGCGGEVEDAIARCYRAVKDVLFFMLEECAKRTVDYGLWCACCAGGVQYVEWVGWGKGDKFYE